VTPPGSRRPDEPRTIADAIWRERQPCWIVWYGTYTQRYWAISAWVPGPAGVIEQPTPAALVAAMNTFEMLHPKPGHQGRR
jgi:hypothetical protein